MDVGASVVVDEDEVVDAVDDEVLEVDPVVDEVGVPRVVELVARSAVDSDAARPHAAANATRPATKARRA